MLSFIELQIRWHSRIVSMKTNLGKWSEFYERTKDLGI